MRPLSALKRLLLVAALAGAPLGGALAQGRAGAATEEERLAAEAEEYFEKGRYEDAAKAYDEVLRLNQNRVPSLLRRATLHLRAGELPAALELLGRAQALAPEDLDVRTVLGLCLQKSAEPAERRRGLSLLEQVAARRPESYEAQLAVGEAYAERDPARASAALERYFLHRPDARRGADAGAQLRLGTAYFLLGRFADAVVPLRAAQEARPQDLRARLLYGAALLGKGGREDLKQAAQLHEAAAAEPGGLERRPRVAYNLALCYLRLGRTGEAARLAERYAALRPGEARAQLLLGDIALAKSDARQALRHYSDAERMSAQQGQGLAVSVGLRQARAYLASRSPAQAVALVEAARAQAPVQASEEGALVAALLEGRLQQGETEGLDELATRLQQLGPRDALALALAGSGALAAGNLEKARRLFAEALGLDQKEPRARAGLVQVLGRLALQDEAKGGRAQAIGYLEQALPLDNGEGSKTVRNLAALYLLDGRPHNAERVLAPHLQGGSSGRLDPVLWRLHGRALLMLNQPAAALQALERAVADAAQRGGDRTDVAELRMELGSRYREAERLDEAVGMLEQGLREGAASKETTRAAAQRALAFAYLQRGRRRLATFEEQGQAGAPTGKLAEEALVDLQQAVERGGLDKRETATALCLSALAAAQATRYGTARAQLQKAQDQGGCELVAPYDRLGAELLSAYLGYRDTGSVTQREQALRQLGRLLTRAGAGPTAALLRSLQRSTSELLAYDFYVAGKVPKAAAVLRGLAKGGGAEAEAPLLLHNQAVLELLQGKPAAATTAERLLERISQRVPEALLNLALLAERRGDAKRSLELLRRAQERGVKSPKLREWIDAKERLLGEGL